MGMISDFNEKSGLLFNFGGVRKIINKERKEEAKGVDFMETEYQNNYAWDLINKAITVKKLTTDELDEIELSDLCESTEILGQDEFDDSKWKIILTTGEEIEIELI